jgi:hypothetical protein
VAFVSVLYSCQVWLKEAHEPALYAPDLHLFEGTPNRLLALLFPEPCRRPLGYFVAELH